MLPPAAGNRFEQKNGKQQKQRSPLINPAFGLTLLGRLPVRLFRRFRAMQTGKQHNVQKIGMTREPIAA
jgi:hypothetical protein